MQRVFLKQPQCNIRETLESKVWTQFLVVGRGGPLHLVQAPADQSSKSNDCLFDSLQSLTVLIYRNCYVHVALSGG